MRGLINIAESSESTFLLNTWCTLCTAYDINLWAPCVLYIGTGVSLLSRESFLYI